MKQLLLIILISFCSLQGFGQSTNGAKLYMNMNENSSDATGNSNNGIDTDIVYSQANGRVYQGSGFNGSSSQIEVTDNNSLDISYMISISFWIYIKSAVAYATILTKGNESGTPYVNYSIDLGSDGLSIRLLWYGGYSYRYWYSGTNILTVNKWYKVDITHQFGYFTKSKLWINSVPLSITGVNATFGTITNSYSLRIGARNSPIDRFLNANLDMIEIRNTLLTDILVKNDFTLIKGQFSN